jgi:hypothetical protein
MTKHDLIELKYRFKHASTGAQKRAVIDSYKELEGKSIKDVEGILDMKEAIEKNKTVKQVKVCKRLRRAFNFDS